MIDFTKPVRTVQDKWPVRILCTDAPGNFPVVGLASVYTSPATWALDGRYTTGAGHPMDLENVPAPPKPFRSERWVNVYPHSSVMQDLFYSKAEADLNAGKQRVACVKVIIEGNEGDGL
jgi:hypothetical protein